MEKELTLHHAFNFETTITVVKHYAVNGNGFSSARAKRVATE